MVYILFAKLHERHEGFSFYGPRKSEEGADTDQIHNFLLALFHIHVQAVIIFLAKVPDYFVLLFCFVGHTMNGCEICLMIISYILFVCTIPFSLCVCIKVSYLINI